MGVRRSVGLLAGATALVAASTFGVGGPSASASVSDAARAVAAPFARFVASTRSLKPPTTSQCLANLGFACYGPIQYQTAYDMNPLYAQGLTGKGMTIALVDSFGSPTIGADLAAFDRGFGLPAPPSFTVIQPAGPVPPFDPNNSAMVGWAEETSLDVEYAHGIAPGANILLVETPVAETEGTVGFPQIVMAENYVIDHNLADVISQSFGATEETFPNQQSLLNLRSAFLNAQARKVTVLASSGDAGSTDFKFNGTDLYLRRVNSWPSSDPLVTSVGGTQLHLNNAGQRLLVDNVWNDTNFLGSPAAGGGGVSSVFSRPSYQDGVSSVVGARRGTPDVSLSAAVDGGALVFLGFPGIPPGFYVFGGTSEASPLFSGVAAIADQAAGRRLGLLNPRLYQLGLRGAPGLPDITVGNNTVSFVQGGAAHTVPGFVAVPGYDLASGLGTVDGAMLVKELAS